MSLYFQATTTHAWSPVGQTPLLRVSPQRDHVHLYGAVVLPRGQEFCYQTTEVNSEQTLIFLEQLVAAFPNQPLFLLWDRATWHRGTLVQDWLKAHPLLYYCFFPPASPHLNPQEHVWERARDCISHNHSFQRFADLCQAFTDFLQNTAFPFKFIEKYLPPSLCTV